MPPSRTFNSRLPRRVGIAAALIFWTSIASTAADSGTPPRLLVLNKHGNSMMAFDVPSRRRIATVAVGNEPHEVAVTPDGRKCYVSNVGDRSITAIDLNSWSVLRTLAPERMDTPHGLGISRDGRFLLATSEGSRRFYLFETARDVLLRALTSTEEGMHLLAMPARGWDAYVANRSSDSITVLNAKRLNIEAHIRVGDGPEGIALTPDGRLLLVALQNAGEVLIMKPGSDRIVARVAAGKTPIRIAVSPDGAMALVSNRHGDDLTIIDLDSKSASGSIEVGQNPGGLVFSPDGSLAFVANNGSDSVSIVSIEELKQTGQIEVGAHPDGVAIVPGKPAAGDASGSKRRSRGTRTK